MSEQDKENMLELLSGQAFSDLSEAELAELAELEKLFPELKADDSFEIAAATVSLTNLDISEQMPAHLQAKILADAEQFFAARETDVAVSDKPAEEYQKTFAFEPRRSIWQWLGWAVAAAACVVLAFNLLNPRVERIYVQQQQVTPTPTPPVSQQLEQLLATADVVKTTLTNPKNPSEVLGDIAWSDSAQRGFVRLRGVPVNDKAREQYQLWIFASNQDPKTPVDGGVFDVGAGGEVIIPIDAKIKVQKPTLFAVTAEKPGGVVVSKQEKVMAIAKVET
jgi:anti-sigma-K factor RskA